MTDWNWVLGIILKIHLSDRYQLLIERFTPSILFEAPVSVVILVIIEHTVLFWLGLLI
jgi:hypothetical protein